MLINSLVPILKSSNDLQEYDTGNYFLLNLSRTEIDLKKENIVFLHGWLGSTEEYVDAFKRFSDAYNVFAINLRGHGSSDAPLDTNWNSSNFANDIHQIFLNYFGSAYKIILVTSSLSSAIGLKFLEIYKNHVDCAVLVSPTSRFNLPLWFKGMSKISNDTLLRGVLNLLNHSSRFIFDYNLSRLIQRFVDTINSSPIEIQRKIVEETLSTFSVDPKSISTPVLIISADQDKVIPIEDSIELFEHLPNSGLIILKDTRHTIVSERPDLIFDIVEFYLLNSSESFQDQIMDEKSIMHLMGKD